MLPCITYQSAKLGVGHVQGASTSAECEHRRNVMKEECPDGHWAIVADIQSTRCRATKLCWPHGVTHCHSASKYTIMEHGVV